MKRKIIFNVGEKMTRVAVLEGQDLAELFIEKNDNVNAVGNIYKGVIEGVIPGLQAVFVNIGTGKNAFLHFNDVDVEPFLAEALRERQSIRRRSRTRPREGGAPDQGYYIRIEDCLTRGREIMVQMTKEPISTKGARVSANLTLAGRYLVLMPGSEGKGGVSKKVEDLAERRRLKKILAQIDVPDCSFIIRTAGIGRTAAEIYADVDNLLDRWDEIQQKARRSKAPALVYSEQDCFSRIVRDNFPDNVDEIVIDHAPSRDKLVAALEESIPELAPAVRLHTDPRNVFEKHRVEKAIFTALQRKVPLKSGGYLIFDECEALTVIDINSGSFVGGREQEKMIQRINLEACEEIARQLRLRDIGGLIVIDFIDMATRDGQRRVVERFREELHKDRTRVSIGRFSDFGILEVTRKRVRNSLRNTLTKACPYCGGSGRIAIESVVWKQIRYDLLAQLTKHRAGSFEVIVHPHVCDYITEHLTPMIAAWEKEFGARIDVRVQKSYHFETYSILRNGKVLVESGMDKIESFHDVEYIAPTAATASAAALDEEEDDREVVRGRAVPASAADFEDEIEPVEVVRPRGDDRRPAAAPDARPARRGDAVAESNGAPAERRRGGRGRRRGREQVLEQREAHDETDEERDAYSRLPERDDEPGFAPSAITAIDAEEEDDAPGAAAPNEPSRRDDRREDRRRGGRRGRDRRDRDRDDRRADDRPATAASAPAVRPAAALVPATPPAGAPASSAYEPRPRVPVTSAPGLYGDLVGVVPIRRKSKRVRFDHNQEPLAHYGETAMGPRPGSKLPAKVARPPHATVMVDESTMEPSLLVRDLQRAAGDAPAAAPRSSAPRPAEKKMLASPERQASRRRGAGSTADAPDEGSAGARDAKASTPTDAESAPSSSRRRSSRGGAAGAAAKKSAATAKPAAKGAQATDAEKPAASARRSSGSASSGRAKESASKAAAAKSSPKKPAAKKPAASASSRTSKPSSAKAGAASTAKKKAPASSSRSRSSRGGSKG